MNRIWSVDATRTVAIFFVVAIHTHPFQGLGAFGNAIDFVLNSLARFAVPFFFLTAGYLVAEKRRETPGERYVAAYLRRIVGLYAFGIAITLPFRFLLDAGTALVHGRSVAVAVVARLAAVVHPPNLLYYGEGVSITLWFLPALFYSVALVVGLKRFGLGAAVLPLAFGLHLAGFFGQGLSVFFALPIRTRDALFFGFFFTALGFALSERDPPTGAGYRWLYLAAFGLASALRVGESYLSGYVLGDAGVSSVGDGVYAVDYSPMTAVVATSLFLFLLSARDLGRDTPLPKIGQYAVGVFVVHPVVILLLWRIGARAVFLSTGVDPLDSLLWHLLFTPTVFGSSLLLYALLERYGVVDRFLVWTDALLRESGRRARSYGVRLAPAGGR